MNRQLSLRLLGALTALSVASVVPAHAAETDQRDAHVRVENVQVVLSQAGPVVLLKVRGKAIPVFVDAVVAESINAALTGRRTARPLSHDLMHGILQAFDGRVSQVVVTLKDRIYHGALTVILGSTTKVFDSRSSDAIALAIHFKAPILVSQELLDASGVELEKPQGIPL